MCLFVETIRVDDGKPLRLHYHNERMNRTRHLFFPQSVPLDLSTLLPAILPAAVEGRWKCRVVYDESIRDISFSPYVLRPVSSLQVVHADDINYTYKYCDRRSLDEAFARRGMADDVLLVKNGLITDTSIGNVAFCCDGQWYTPSTPLLAGTMRQSLLDKGVLHEAEITLADAFACSRLSVFNAMIGWQEISLELTEKTLFI